MKVDLNCDLGEGEAPAQTRALMRAITSANIACGGHAGDLASMEACVRMAKSCGVKVGAHPGTWDKRNFGRTPARLDARSLELLLLQQVGALERIAGRHRVKLHHVKLHGWLYHATEREPALAKAYLQALRRWWPKLIVYSLAGGTVAKCAARIGVQVWPEAFLDRAYRDDGSLVPRGKPAALVYQLRPIRERLRTLVWKGGVVSASGGFLKMNIRTLCVHSDTPGAARLARLARDFLREATPPKGLARVN